MNEHIALDWAEALQADPDERPSWLQPIGIRLAIILGLSAAPWLAALVIVRAL